MVNQKKYKMENRKNWKLKKSKCTGTRYQRVWKLKTLHNTTKDRHIKGTMRDFSLHAKIFLWVVIIIQIEWGSKRYAYSRNQSRSPIYPHAKPFSFKWPSKIIFFFQNHGRHMIGSQFLYLKIDWVLKIGSWFFGNVS